MIAVSDVAIRLLLAALLGAVIGIDRGRLEWAAGLRTHMLVCVGAALAMIVSAYGFSDILRHPQVILDPSRIAAQVISGVSFIGAGTILFLQRERVVRGLTTAAGLWAVAAIGLAAGSGLYAAAIMATALMWTILALLKPLERRYLNRHGRMNLQVTLRHGTSLAGVENAMAQLQLPLRRIVLRRHADGEDTLEIRCAPDIGQARLLEAAGRLAGLEGVVAVATPDSMHEDKEDRRPE